MLNGLEIDWLALCKACDDQTQDILRILEFWKFFINVWTDSLSILILLSVLLKYTNFLSTHYQEQWMIWDFSLLVTMGMKYEDNYLSVGKHKWRTKRVVI